VCMSRCICFHFFCLLLRPSGAYRVGVILTLTGQTATGWVWLGDVGITCS
jgi:hypothetical protein